MGYERRELPYELRGTTINAVVKVKAKGTVVLCTICRAMEGTERCEHIEYTKTKIVRGRTVEEHQYCKNVYCQYHNMLNYAGRCPKHCT